VVCEMEMRSKRLSEFSVFYKIYSIDTSIDPFIDPLIHLFITIVTTVVNAVVVVLICCGVLTATR